MSWISSNEDDGISSSDEEDITKSDIREHRINRLDKSRRRIEESRYSDAEKSRVYLSEEQLNSCNPYIQEPNSDNENNLQKFNRTEKELKNLLSVKDDRIRVLEKLINGQREQLYHFLNLSFKEESLIELKKSCRETDGLNRNENMSMALDKFKYDNNLPTEQTLVRKEVSKTLLKIERLMRHQLKLVKTIESSKTDDQLDDNNDDKSIELINWYRSDDQLTELEKLLKGTKYIDRKLQMVKIQLKKLALIEEERIDLVERVYSMPAEQRQYYANLAVIEREKIHLVCEIDRLTENYRELKQKCSLLEETEEELNRSVDAKIADIDLDEIKPGLEKHLELMDMVERGEVSLIKMSKNEKGKFKDDFVKLCNENTEISKRLKDFDEVTKERDNLKEQIEILVENSSRLQNEIKSFKLSNKRDNLLEEMREIYFEKEELKNKFQRSSKEVLEIVKLHNEKVEKISEERDQLRSKLARYLNIEEDMKSLQFKASQCEAYYNETERLKIAVTELEDQVKTAHIALLDMNAKNSNLMNSMDCKNMAKKLEDFREVEEEKERLSIEISRYKYALLRQEEEVKDLVKTVEKLIDQVKILQSKNSAINPAEGTPEGPEMMSVLNIEEEKRVDMIKRRVCGPETLKPFVAVEEPDQTVPIENTVSEKNHNIINSIKSFLGLKDISNTID